MSERSDDQVPRAWAALDVARWRGPILVVGEPDTGKSTFARYLYEQLREPHDRVALLDADVGQNHVRRPTSMTLALTDPEQPAAFPPAGPTRTFFVGSNSPVRHMLELLTGLHAFLAWLNRHAPAVDALVVDTDGLVDPRRGGTNLKWAQIEMLRPCTVVALRRGDELEPLLLPLHPWRDVRVVELDVPDAVQRRSQRERRAYRAGCYRELFEPAGKLALSYHGVAVFPRRSFRKHRIAALENAAGFTLALALVTGADQEQVYLRTTWPASRRDEVAALHLGDLVIEPGRWEDHPL
jgi:polynucleotide 5'-kinase involved in rRNA processing